MYKETFFDRRTAVLDENCSTAAEWGRSSNIAPERASDYFGTVSKEKEDRASSQVRSVAFEAAVPNHPPGGSKADRTAARPIRANVVDEMTVFDGRTGALDPDSSC